jgi:chromosome partitioning protein
VASEINKHFAKQIYKTVIPRNVRLSESPSHGKTIIEYDKKCAGAKAYMAFADEFIGRIRKGEEGHG